MHDRKNFTLSLEAIEQLKEMAISDNRTMSNFLEILIAQEYTRRKMQLKLPEPEESANDRHHHYGGRCPYMGGVGKK